MHLIVSFTRVMCCYAESKHSTFKGSDFAKNYLAYLKMNLCDCWCNKLNLRSTGLRGVIILLMTILTFLVMDILLILIVYTLYTVPESP